MHRIRRLLPPAFLLVALGAAAAAVHDGVEQAPEFGSGVRVGRVESALINEASGMAASRQNPGVLWTHNDSGDRARVFAMTTGGKLLGVYSLFGASAVDWEDLAVGPGPEVGTHYLYAGDIGDNFALRSFIRVYRIREPEVKMVEKPAVAALSRVDALTLQYEDGPRDAETLIVDPMSGDLYIISKREAKSRVYRAAASALMTRGTILLRKVAELPWGWATGGDVSPRGDLLVVRTTEKASVWRRPAGQEMWKAFDTSEFPVPVEPEPQGEAIAFNASGSGYYTTSEGLNQPIYSFAAKASDESGGN